MPDVEKVIKGLEVILEETADMYYRSTVQDALALLKAQEPAYVEERLVLDKLSNIQDYARVNEINWMADGAAYAETVIGALQGRISALLKAQEPVKPVFSEEKYGDALDHCPSCERALPNRGEYGKSYYCYNCGQAVKWE